MNKPVYLLPFIFVYRVLAFIIKLPFKIVLYNLYAFILICFITYKFVRYVGLGFSFPFVVIYRLLKQIKIPQKEKKDVDSIDEVETSVSLMDKRISEMIKSDEKIVDDKIKDASIEEAKSKAIARRKELAAIEEENRKKREIAKLEKYALEQQKKEAKRKAKAEKREARRKQLEKNVYKNENVKKEKKSFKESLQMFGSSIVHLPTTISVWAKAKYSNSTFVKNNQNKKEIQRQALLIDFDGDDAIKSEKKQVYQYEAKNKVVEKDPTEGIQSPKIEKRVPSVLT